MKTIGHFATAIGIAAVSHASAAADMSVPTGLSVTDWSSLREAYDAGRHAVKREENGKHAARNPGQQWRTEFDGRGFMVLPDHGQWTWGLELQTSAFPHITTLGNRISYHWGENLVEWFINDHRGLEQGWTIQSPPATGNTGEAVTLGFKIRGGLSPRISGDQRCVTFQTPAETAALVYGGLKAWDAVGKSLDVRFVPGADRASLGIEIDDDRATYPITVDPIAQQAYLKAAIVDSDDQFGTSVAISGDTVVIGAVGEDGAATGVGGNQANNAASGSGAAYVFVRSGGAWSQQAYLKASNTGAGDAFGGSVAISGDTVVVGAGAEDSNETGTTGTGVNNGAMDSGAAYVFVRDGGGNWTHQAYLKASNTGAGEEFGHSVGISGDTVVVGSHLEDTGTPGSGAAYIFVRSGTSWTQQAFLKASNSGTSDRFGTSVAISDDTMIVGAIREGSDATGVNGNQNNENALDSGAAYVFLRSGTSWSQQAYLKASNTGTSDFFGWSVAVSGDTAVVGAEREQSNATGVNGDGANNGQPFAGAAYVYVRSGTIWSHQAYLKASNTDAGDRFGKAVAISGDKLVVGAAGEDSNATGVNGNQNSITAADSGAAYYFLRSGSSWSQQAYLKASNTGSSDGFGESVAISGDTVMVTAKGEASAATGVNGNQTDNSTYAAGAAYVIDLNAPAIAEIAVEQPENTDLTSGVSTVDFGEVLAQSEISTRDFVIMSTGSIGLTGIIASLSVANEGDFTITTEPAESLPAGNSTGLTVRFNPSGSGVSTATLSIASNDPDEDPFLIELTGVGVTNASQLFDAAVAAAGLVGPNAGPASIPFKDGVGNLLKYAFNMNLAGPDNHTLQPGGSSGLPSGVLVEESGQSYWKCEFLWRANSELIYTPTKSTDLETFEPLTGGMNFDTIDDDWQKVTVLEPVDFESTPKLFFRVEVTLP